MTNPGGYIGEAIDAAKERRRTKLKSNRSVNKGKQAERRGANWLTLNGFPSERNARNGLSEPDLICPSLGHLNIEVKHVRAIRLGTKALYVALEQAEKKAGEMGPNIQGVVLWFEHAKGWRLTWRGYDGTVYTVARGGDVLMVLRRLNNNV